MRRAAVHAAALVLLATSIAVWLPACGGAVGGGGSGGPNGDFYGVNLLRNPSAEEGSSSDQHPGPGGEPGLVAVPGWDTLERYGNLGCIREYAVTGGLPQGGGAKYFAFGGFGNTFSQVVDLSPLAADIDAGRVECTLQATVGVRNPKYGGQVELIAYVDEYTPRRCGSVLGPDSGIHSTAGLLARGERYVRVRIGIWDYEGGVDDVSLVLTGPAGT